MAARHNLRTTKSTKKKKNQKLRRTRDDTGRGA